MQNLFFDRSIFFVFLLTACAHAPKPPVLEEMETITIPVHFRGAEFSHESLWVCGTTKAGVFSCIPYQVFHDQLGK